MVDNGVVLFREDLQALQVAYDNLASSLKDSAMIGAARETNRYAGGNLWMQVSAILGDCQTTVLYIRQALENVQQSSRRVSSMLKNLTESLKNGELCIAKDTIKLLEQNLVYSKAMVNITLQVQQPGFNRATQHYIIRDLERLKTDVNSFCAKVRSIQSSQSVDGRTFQHLEEFAFLANHFLTSVSSSMMDLLPTPTMTVTVEPPPSAEGSPAFWSEKVTINVPERYEELDAATTTYRSSSIATHDAQSNAYDSDGENENEIELELVAEYVANGQADLEMEDFTSAEENFRAALETVQETEFLKPPKHSAGDITLMLVDCCLKQDKEEEALVLLESIADGTAESAKGDTASTTAGSVREIAEQSLQYKANHMLSVVFLKRLDFQAAEKRAKQALKGRRKVLGAQDPATLESVQLLIDIFTAKGDKVNARAYRRFLEPPAGKSKTPSIVSISQAPPPSRTAASTPATVQTSATAGKPQAIAPSRTATIRTAVPSPQAPIHLQTRKPLQSPPKLPSPPPSTTSNRNPSQPTGLAQIAEHETPPIISPVETRFAVTPLAATPIEPDPLPPNTGPANTAKKMSWSNPFSRLSVSKAEADGKRKMETVTPESSSRNSSVTAVNQIGQPANTQKRLMSLTGSFALSDHTKKEDYGDTNQPQPSMTSFRTPSINTTLLPPRTRQEMVPRFTAIRSLRQEGKKSIASDTAIKLLQEYDPHRRDLIVREAELRKNMKESHRGLAATGYGYAPIHFFCERKTECAVEVELLIEQGVDVNAVACKAGMPGTDPFTPLQRAIENGHAEIVRLLVEADVQMTSPKGPKMTTLSNDNEILQPLLLACTKGHVQITYILLVAGAAKILKGFPQQIWHGNSLLHEAAWRGDIDMVKMLLDYSKKLGQEHGQQGVPGSQPNYQSGIIGTPGQQDQFGATSIMYALDIRDCINDKMRRVKLANCKGCLQLLLEHDAPGDLHSQKYCESVAKMLSLKWTRGPGTGHSIFCYANESGDEELIRILDPFMYQCPPSMRCAATPRCSPGVTKMLHPNQAAEADGALRTARLPSFPELMSEPVLVEVGWPQEMEHLGNRDSVLSNESLPPSFASAVASWSPTNNRGRTLSMNMSIRSGSDGRGIGSDR